MNRFFLISLTLLFSLQSLGSEIWIATPKPVTRDELDEITEKYRALVKTSDIVSLYDFLLAHPISNSQMAVILDLDSLGRAASLNGNFKKALEYYTRLEGILENF